MKVKVVSICLLVLGVMASGSLQALTVIRGPYLQLQTSDSVIIRWRTDAASDSVVRYGASVGNLDTTVTVAGSRTDHEVSLAGLGSGQQFWYSVGDSSAPLAGTGDATYHFHTAPVQGQAADTRVWVIGDSGTANSNARAVRDAYKTWSGSTPADLWLMLGDNAYNDGTDAEYQSAVFDTYPEILRQLPLWSTLGNHDGHSADSTTQSGPYYDIFSLPIAGEAGGLASGTEAYYSFDYANIHFVCLDSYDTNRAVDGSMLQWLEADLATNTQPWVIAFWHHPPYTKGSHNSDTEGRLIDMRQNALPILEAWGVDLVLTGHSHSYERSKLLDGHYGVSTSLDPGLHVLDSGSGRESGDGAYDKPDIIAAQNAGAVYAVAGSSGKISGGLLNHPAMYISLNSLGSMALDISGNRMDVTFIDDSGSALDHFTMIKTPDFDPPLLSGATALDANHVIADFSEALNSTEAESTANYSIAGLTISNAELLEGSRSVRLTTTSMTTGANYTLEVNNLRDLAGNTIISGSSTAFDFFERFTVAFQDGLLPTPEYSGTSDAYIREASATTAHGAETSLQVDGDEPSGSTSDMNILLAWDTGSIPLDAIVESAKIQLDVTNPSNGSYGCYALQTNWEQSSVTWNQASAGINWGTPGAEAVTDRGSELVCTVTAGSTGILTVDVEAEGIALVQSWVSNPDGNHGIIVSNSATSDGADFHSSESGAAMSRPKLEVNYRLPVVEPPGYIDRGADADEPSAGTVSGTFIDTLDDDGTYQAITERESGGKKNQRHSFLSHTWRIPAAAGTGVTVYANTWSSGSADGDEFIFAWSDDNSQFEELFRVDSTDPANVQSAVIGTGGTIYIRVSDSDQSAGHRDQDTVFVDQLYIRSNTGVPDNPPLEPDNLVAGGASSSTMTLSWEHDSADVEYFELERSPHASSNWQALANPPAGSVQYLDSGLAESTSYDYRIRAKNGAGPSLWSNTATGTTKEGATIGLTASGYKVRGKHHVDLEWWDATTGVEIIRDGGVIAPGDPSGTYTDATDNKGGRTYIYRVCEAGSTTCSDDVEVTF